MAKRLRTVTQFSIGIQEDRIVLLFPEYRIKFSLDAKKGFDLANLLYTLVGKLPGWKPLSSQMEQQAGERDGRL